MYSVFVFFVFAALHFNALLFATPVDISQREKRDVTFACLVQVMNIVKLFGKVI